MPSSEDWIVASLIVGAVVVGLAVLVLRKKASPRRLELRKTNASIYENEEVWEPVRDSSGRLLKVVVHRRVRRIK